MGTPVSGPGQFSKRTDKAVENANQSLPNAGYGEAKAYQEQKQGADMASGGNPDFAAMFGDAASRVVPMNAPTNQPDVPVTNGAAAGAGAGMDVLGLQDQQKVDLQSIAPYLPVMEFMANQPGASWAMRNRLRELKGQM